MSIRRLVTQTETPPTPLRALGTPIPLNRPICREAVASLPLKSSIRLLNILVLKLRDTVSLTRPVVTLI